MTEYDLLKPWLTALILPPSSPLLLIFLGYLMAVRSERILWMAIGKMVFVMAFAALWLFCTQGTAIFLERVVLRPPAALDPQLVQPSFQADNIQAIVVLGGGMQSANREYGPAALSDASGQRLHYAVTLSRQTGLPIAFSGGKSWASPVVNDSVPTPPINPPAAEAAASATNAKPSAKVTSVKPNPGAASGSAASSQTPILSTAALGSEAAAAQNWLAQLGLPPARWVDDQSRDTAGNAQSIAAILKKDGITRIALVSHASHMPRAIKEFEASELKVLPAPTYFTVSEQGIGLDWLPSGQGLRNTRRVLHEILGLFIQRRSASA
jgi:uncharacterized SAM-binding protein YcdF (DUF218 family)